MRFLISVCVSLSILTTSILVFADTTQAELTPLQKDQKNAVAQVQLIKANFNSDKDLDRAVAAIVALQLMPYKDIPDLLISLTMEELSKGRQKKRIIGALLEAVRSRVTSEHSVPQETGGTPPLISLQTRLLSLVNDPNFRTHKSAFVENVKGAMNESFPRSHSNQEKLFAGATLSSENLLAKYSALNTPEKTENSVVTVDRSESIEAKKYQKFVDSLKKIQPSLLKDRSKEVKAGRSSPAELVYAGTTRFITDDLAEKIANGTNFKILNRDDVVERVLLVLSRYKQRNAILIGSRGSGKTSIIDRLAEMIVLNQVGQNEVTEFLSDSVVIQTSAGKISGLALTDKPAGQLQAAEEYFRALSEVQKATKRRIVVFIDEIHTFTSQQVEAIKPILESSDGQILLVGASTSPEWRAAFKHNEAFLRRTQEVPVREFSENEIFEIFKNSWLQVLNRQHGELQIDEKSMRLIIRKATMVYPDKGMIDGAFQLTDDIANALRYRKNDKSIPVQITTQEVYSFIKGEMGLPVDPTNFVELEAYRVKLINEIRNEVIDQDRMIEDVVDLWMNVLRNESERGVRVGMILGRSYWQVRSIGATGFTSFRF